MANSQTDIEQKEPTERIDKSVQKMLVQLEMLGMAASVIDHSPLPEGVDYLTPRWIEIEKSPIFVSVGGNTFDLWVRDLQINPEFPHVSLHKSRESTRWEKLDPEEDMAEFAQEFFVDGLSKRFDSDVSAEIAAVFNSVPELNVLEEDVHIDVESHLTAGCWIVRPLPTYETAAIPSHFWPLSWLRFLWYMLRGRDDDPIIPQPKEWQFSDLETCQVVAKTLLEISPSIGRTVK